MSSRHAQINPGNGRRRRWGVRWVVDGMEERGGIDVKPWKQIKEHVIS